MATYTKVIKVDDQKKDLIIDVYSDTPNIKDGTRVAAFRVLATTDYVDGDTVVVQLDGAKSIKVAYCKKTNATAMIALTEATTTNPAGLSLTTGAITTAVTLEFFIVYNVES